MDVVWLSFVVLASFKCFVRATYDDLLDLRDCIFSTGALACKLYVQNPIFSLTLVLRSVKFAPRLKGSRKASCFDKVFGGNRKYEKA